MFKPTRFIRILAPMLALVLIVACGEAETPAAAPAQPTATTALAAAEEHPTEATEEQPTEATEEQPTEATEEQPTEATEEHPTEATAGGIVADLGFRPEANGFSFENYGGDSGAQNLTPEDV